MASFEIAETQIESPYQRLLQEAMDLIEGRPGSELAIAELSRDYARNGVHPDDELDQTIEGLFMDDIITAAELTPLLGRLADIHES